VAGLLGQVRIVETRPEIPGYDRDCGAGHACSFGVAWTDDVDVKLGHNGCSTRDDILARDLSATMVRAGTNGCVVVAGVLVDPYSGTRLEFRKETAYEVPVDHIYSLARAWDLGAATWTPDRRRDFANDPRNLVAAGVTSNSTKGDTGPGEWLPADRAGRCRYAAAYLEVAVTYDLAVTRADADAAAELSCSSGS